MTNRYIIFIHIFIAILISTVIYLGFKPLVNVSTTTLIVDSCVSGVILSSLLILLKFFVKYNHFSSLISKQKAINYSALAILFVVIWLGLEYLLLQSLFTNEEYEVFIATLPIRIILGLLIYCIMILVYIHKFLSGAQTEEGLDTGKDDMPTSMSPLDTNIVEENKETLERVVVKNGQKIEVIPISEIIHLQAEGDYVMIYAVKGKFLKEQTMKSFESDLPSDKFVRIHRSSIINIDYIAQIELYEKQSQLLKLKNGAQVKMSLSGYKVLKKTLGL